MKLISLDDLEVGQIGGTLEANYILRLDVGISQVT